MELYAISDLHLGHPVNYEALPMLPYYPEDWLILAGDTGETTEHLRYALSVLTRRFAQVIWTPGNHDLWTLPATNTQQRNAESLLRGEAKYRRLVSICHEFGVITPEDPYVMWRGEGGPALLAPLFLLYDYSFRPDSVPLEKAVEWSAETDVVCVDEYLLHPDPYPTRSAWCLARSRWTKERLSAAASSATPFILINHFPLNEPLAVLPRIPRFSIWCGTRSTNDWHTAFPTIAAVYGHLHIPSTKYLDGVRFEEVSLGYPQQWDQSKGIQSRLRRILPAKS
jgi:3',5'-cyclic AMP phosphodiesterase CpdA